jgi:molybdenum cofactor cytidylyltransferase
MIGAIVLAAGRSRRMGTQKLLLKLGGKPVISRIVDEVLRCPIDAICVVIGQDGLQVMEVLSGRRVQFVRNDTVESDMLSSVRCGLQALPASCTEVLVVLGDQPTLSAKIIVKLIEALRLAPDCIAVPAYGGKRGHPLLFASQYRDELLARHDEAGLRGLILSHPDKVVEVESDTPSVLEDMDRPEDYERIAALFSKEER